MTDAAIPTLAVRRAPRSMAAWHWIVVAAALMALPFFTSGYVTYMACLVLVNIIATVGLNITVGYSGLLSIGHSAFVGVGAYTCAILWNAGVPLPLSILSAAVMAFLVGVLFGLPALRIRGVYLAIATLAAQYCLYFIFSRWTGVTGGDRGLNTPTPEFLGFSFNTDLKLYFMILPFTILACIVATNLFETRVGRAFIAVRERDYAAQVLGINVVRTKLWGFGIGAAYAGIAGALMVLHLRAVNPEQFTLAQSVFFLTAVIVGGRGSVAGSVLGAAFITLVPEMLRFGVDVTFDDPSRYATFLAPAREFIFGILIVCFLLADPRGLAGVLKSMGLPIRYRG
jgi:branched-chain amino acid transport system permease protein